MIIIFTPLSFIPAMNIYETPVLDGPNWKSIYSMWPGLKTQRRQRVNELGRIMAVVLPWSPISVQCLCFTQYNKMQAHLGSAIRAN